MTLYHCSPTPGLRVLRPSVTKYFGKPRQVCLTASLPMALMYGIKHFEYAYGFTKTKEIYYEEYFPGALEELYRGRPLQAMGRGRRPRRPAGCNFEDCYSWIQESVLLIW